MKKILSVALALLMMLAVCVPAFATKSITDKTPEKTADTLVKTDTNREDGSSGESYTVEIPLMAKIPWGKNSYSVDYYVEAHLAYGKRLSVKVDFSGKMALADDAAETLEYTLSGTTLYRSEKPVVYTPGVKQPLSIEVTDLAWAKAIVGEYSDLLTFTAEVEEV